MKSDPLVAQLLDEAMGVDDFTTWTRWALGRLRFDPANSLAVVGVCRDELMAPFDDAISAAWGRPFEIGSLGGLVFAGATGLFAALSHVPGEDGRHRFVVFCFPHLGVDSDGTAGPVSRRGINHATTACGALAGFREQLAAGHRGLPVDPTGDDVEAALLAARLEQLIADDEVPSLAHLTLLAGAAAVADVRRFVEAAAARTPDAAVDVAYLSGVVLHLLGGNDAVTAIETEVVIDGKSVPLPH